MNNCLYNPNGVMISELVHYLQTEYLDRGRDGEVWIMNTEKKHLSSPMFQASSLHRNDIIFDTRRLKDTEIIGGKS